MPFLEGISPLLYALLGWLLGLLTPEITGGIRDRRRSNQLMKAIAHELAAFQHNVALVSTNFHIRFGELSDQYLDWIIPILESYRGPDREDEGAAMSELRSLREASPQLRPPGRTGVWGSQVHQLSLPLFISHTSELAICPERFRFLALKIRYHVDLYNSSASDAKHWLEKTFAELPESHKSPVHNNLRSCYDLLKLQADVIIRTVNELTSEYP